MNPMSIPASQRLAFLAMLVMIGVSPFILYPVFLMKVLCFALFASAFNLLIGFVGLLGPHIARLLFRTANHRVVAPATALLGGLIVALADTLARTLLEPRQLPVGALLALVGAPVFLSLLKRVR